MPKLQFTLDGKPESQGSIRAFTPKGWTRPILTSTNKNLKKWRNALGLVAKQAIFDMLGNDMAFPTPRPVRVTLRFYYNPPKSNKAVHKVTRPDLDKLMRSTLDGLTGIVYNDDSQVVHAVVLKSFSVNERTEVIVETL